jgi:hypothetical protein
MKDMKEDFNKKNSHSEKNQAEILEKIRSVCEI